LNKEVDPLDNIIAQETHPHYVVGKGLNDEDSVTLVGSREIYDAGYAKKFAKPILNGEIRDMTTLMKIIRWIYRTGIPPDYRYNDDMIKGLDPAVHPVLICEPPEGYTEHTKMNLKNQLGNLGISYVAFENSAILALLNIGINSGVVVMSGFKKTQVITIFNSRIIKIHQSLIGSANYHAEAGKILNVNKVTSLRDEVLISRKMEKLEITIPNKLIPNIILFKDSFRNMVNLIANLTYEAIQSCNKELQDIFWNQIILVGGNTQYSGFEKRFEYEMAKLKKNFKLRSQKTNRVQSVLEGGLIFTSLPSFELEGTCNN